MNLLIKNQEKAKEICNCDSCKACSKFAEKGAAYALSSTCDRFDELMEAMQWKDKERKELWRITRNHYQEWAEEQIAKEKQQLIDKLEDWLANNICNAYNFRGDNISATFINDCIKAMKGE